MNRVFTVNVDGKDVEFTFISPTLKHQEEAQKVYNRTFSNAANSGAFFREELDAIIKARNVWTDSMEAEYSELSEEIRKRLELINNGGFKLKEARKLAIEVADLRQKVSALLAPKTSLDNETVQGQANNMSFNYMVSALTVYNESRKRYFSSLDDYLQKLSDGDEVAWVASNEYAAQRYNLTDDIEKQLPENQFLLQYGFVDDELRFINENGDYIDREGRLLDKDGRYINEDGEFVDKDGNRVDESGEPLLQPKPFLDDNGNPIIKKDKEEVKEEVEPEEKPKKARRGRPKTNKNQTELDNPVEQDK